MPKKNAVMEVNWVAMGTKIIMLYWSLRDVLQTQCDKPSTRLKTFHLTLRRKKTKENEFSGTGNRTRVFPVLQSNDRLKAEYPSLWTIPEMVLLMKECFLKINIYLP